MIEYKKEELEHLYAELKSIRRIAKETGIPKSTLTYYFNKCGIDISQDIDIKEDDLKRLLKELGTVYKVAERLGVHSNTVYNHIEKYNIDLKLFKSRFPYTKEELIKLHDECGSITKVAAKLSRSYSTVRHWYKSLDIVFNPSGMTVFQELRHTPMNSVHRSALIGSMLGDGGIWLAPHSKNARLYVRHCKKQLGYLKWLHELFSPFSRPIKQIELAGEKQIGDYIVNGTDFYSFYTIAHPEITEVYKTYYRDGYKHIIDRTIVDDIDLLAMSIWFGDDGSIMRNKNGEPISCSISTNSFSYKEQLILVDALKKFFFGTISIKRQGGYYKGLKREDYVITMSNKEEISKFLDIIKLVLPECIHYKLS